MCILEEAQVKSTILKFGLISGVVSAGLMALNITLVGDHGTKGLVLGYTAMVLSFLLVYFGIRSYRDGAGGGEITFGRAFGIGISITLISCVFYVVAWEILYFNFLPGFMDNFAAHSIEQMKAAGASAVAIQAKAEQMKQFKAMYDNPLTNAAMTFVEPFPVGLLITLVSAAVLRKKGTGRVVETALPAAS